MIPEEKKADSLEDASVTDVLDGLIPERERKGKPSESASKQKPLEGWNQDITTSAWEVTDDSEEDCNDALENFDFVYRQRGFKQVRLVNFEADGHVSVQVLESSFKLFEMAKFKYDENKPLKEVSSFLWASECSCCAQESH